MNDELKKEVGSLQDAMSTQAEKNPLPKGFVTVTKIINAGKPSVTIVNTNNGKEYECPLYAYSAVRTALNELV